MIRMNLLGAAALLAGMAATTPLFAAEYPDHAINMIVPFAAGGPSDIGGRALADGMGRQLNEAVVVEDFGGAGGNIGAARAARAVPDGYTLMFTNFSIAISPALYDNLGYDAAKDFVSIGVATYTATMVLARNDFPAATFADFTTTLKTNADKMLMATTGPGGPSDLCARLIMKALDVRFTLVPFKGTGPAMSELIPGRVDLMCDSVITAGPEVKAGMVKTYGLTGHERSSFLPDLPTLGEQGLNGVDYKVWSALYAPRKTPQPALDRLAAAFQAALNDADFRRTSAQLGQELASGELVTPAGADAFLQSEITRWAPLLKGQGPAN